MTQMNELGFYTLAGQPNSPRELIDEVQQAEALGIGACFISERFNIKEAATLSGAVGAVSREIGIATAATNHNTRHPLVTASYAMTMHKLTGGRFSLGLGRGIAPMFKAFGLPTITTAQLEDFAGLMRRLWRGETVLGHDGPCGKFGLLSLGPDYTGEIPLTFTAFGPNSLALGGRAMDAVVLHTFFTDETTARCVRAVKEAAERAGRDPARVAQREGLHGREPDAQSGERPRPDRHGERLQLAELRTRFLEQRVDQRKQSLGVQACIAVRTQRDHVCAARQGDRADARRRLDREREPSHAGKRLFTKPIT